ncbi:MAG: flagellar basal body P-ring formation protein FlgA [Acidobacteria bacterium]|nr:flagellar basal body P-ring formation protein FlgA [Acidobacteriota bacterium]
MKCTSRSITLLASLLLPAANACVLVEGARIHASDLAFAAPAFAALPADKDLGPAPAGTLVRVFHKSQLASLLNGAGADLPDSICVQRKREAIPTEVWQSAIEIAMAKLCPETQWKAQVIEYPRHLLPIGELTFPRGGIVASRGPVILWRGALLLPDKTSVPVWVRLDIRTQRRANVLQRALAAGTTVISEDYREETIWAPGLCVAPLNPHDLNGLIAKRAIAQGAELRPEDLRRPPAIHRGQSVEVESASGAARIRIPAVAEQDGEVGERVQLRSSWNGSKLVGRVTGVQKAKVDE